MDDLKTFIVVSLSSLMAYLSPISGVIFSVTIVFIINFAFGYLSGMLVNDEGFSFKKAFGCIKEASIFFILVASVYTIGEHLDNSEGALQSISVVTYALLYFYATNIFKNLCKLFPESRWIAFCYWGISLEFCKRIPFLEDFIKQINNKKNGKN